MANLNCSRAKTFCAALDLRRGVKAKRARGLINAIIHTYFRCRKKINCTGGRPPVCFYERVPIAVPFENRRTANVGLSMQILYAHERPALYNFLHPLPRESENGRAKKKKKKVKKNSQIILELSLQLGRELFHVQSLTGFIFTPCNQFPPAAARRVLGS